MAAPNSVHLSCPSGGTWYICLSSPTKFVGCCTSDPCGNTGCPASDIRPASFNAETYGTFPDQTCSEGSFYTCTNANKSIPPFIGCCRTNPCGAGCSGAQLGQAVLAPDSTRVDGFLNAVGGQGVISSIANAPGQTQTTQNAFSGPTGSARPSSSTNTLPSSNSSSTRLSSSSSSLSSSSSSLSSSISTSAIIPGVFGGPRASDTGSPFSTTSQESSGTGGVPKGTVAGIVVSSFVIMAGFAAIVFLLLTRRKRMAHNLRESKLGPLGDDDASNYDDRPMTQSPQTAQRVSIMAPPIAAAVVDSRSPTPADRRSNRLSVPLIEGAKNKKRLSESEERYGYDEQGRYDNPAGRYYSSPSPSRTSPLPAYDPHSRSSPIYPERTFYGNPIIPPIGNAFATNPPPIIYSYPTAYHYPTIVPNAIPIQHPQNGYLIPAMHHPHDSIISSRPVTLTGLEPVPEADHESVSASSGDASRRTSGILRESTTLGGDNRRSDAWDNRTRYSESSTQYHESMLLASSPPPPSEPRRSALRFSRIGEAYD